MKKPTFSEGVGIALFSSITATAVFIALASIVFSDDLFRIIIASLSLVYIIYLLSRSNQRLGRLSILLFWFICTVTSLIFVPSLLFYIVIQLILIWFIRSLYFYSSILSALTDFVLTGSGLIVAIWVWTTSGSLFLTFWCFFLVQALFVFIPKNFVRNKHETTKKISSNDRFEHAFHAAETAVSKLSKNTFY